MQQKYIFVTCQICHRRHLEYLWVGARDGEVEGVWRTETKKRKVLVAPSSDEDARSRRRWKLPWETRPQEPNGGTKENCAAMKKG